MDDGTKVRFGEVEVTVGSLSVQELRNLLHVWIRKDRLTGQWREGALDGAEWLHAEAIERLRDHPDADAVRAALQAAHDAAVEGIERAWRARMMPSTELERYTSARSLAEAEAAGTVIAIGGDD